MAGGKQREERLAYIEQAIAGSGFISLREIKERFCVNMQTARRDIAHLAERQAVTKVHGGAVTRRPLEESSVEERLSVREDEKRQIARAAASYVRDGDVIFLDGGSTVAHLASFLLDRRIQVVTNSLVTADILKRGWPGVEIVMTGGYYYPKSEFLLGSPAIHTIRGARVDKAFLSAAGVSPDGVFNANVLVTEVEKSVIDHASETYLLADSSKIGAASLVRICGLEDIHTLFTISPVPEALLTAARSAGCRVVIG